MRCYWCGNKLRSTAYFCDRCGIRCRAGDYREDSKKLTPAEFIGKNMIPLILFIAIIFLAVYTLIVGGAGK